MMASRHWTRRGFVGGTLLTPLVLAGCGSQAASAGPPEIAYGRTVCDACGMIISDERFAAALTADTAEPVVFDDVGEMLQAVAAEGLNGRRAWAHDRESKTWIDAATATYVAGDPATTPMGTGIVAFASRDAAEAFAAAHGAAFASWEDALRSSA
jgi:copper chaperone NosL